MAVAVTSVSSAATGAGTGDATVTKPTSVVAGNLLLTVVYNDISPLTSTPSGFSQVGSYQTRSGAGNQSIWIKVATGSEPANYLFTSGGAGASACAAMLNITGADPVSPVVSPVTAQGGAATTAQTAPSVTPTAANSLLVCSFDELGAVDTYSVPTGMTSVTGGTSTINDGSANLAVFYQQLSTAAATGTRASTASGSAAYNSFSIIVEPAASPNIQSAPPNRARICSSNFL